MEIDERYKLTNLPSRVANGDLGQHLLFLIIDHIVRDKRKIPVQKKRNLCYLSKFSVWLLQVVVGTKERGKVRTNSGSPASLVLDRGNAIYGPWLIKSSETRGRIVVEGGKKEQSELLGSTPLLGRFYVRGTIIVESV
jgi:hypothetical protein